MGVCCYQKINLKEPTEKIENNQEDIQSKYNENLIDKQIKNDERSLIKIKKIIKSPGQSEDFFTFFDKQKKYFHNKSSFKIDSFFKNNKNIISSFSQNIDQRKIKHTNSNRNIESKDTSNAQSLVNHTSIVPSVKNGINKNIRKTYTHKENLRSNIIPTSEETEELNGEKGMIIKSRFFSNNEIKEYCEEEEEKEENENKENENSFKDNEFLIRFPTKKVADRDVTEDEERQIKEIFHKLYLFDVFPEDALDIILSSLVLLYISKNDIFLNKGANSHCFYIVLEGELDVYDEFDDNKIIKTYKEWDCFGHTSLMNKNMNEEIKNKIVARENSQLFILDGETFLEIQERMLNHRLDERFEFLNNIIFFKGLDAFQKHNLAEKMNLIFVEENKKIITRGEMINTIYLIKEGSVSCRYNGKECKVIRSNNYVGIVSVLLKSARTLDVYTKEDCSLFEIKGSDLQDALGNNYIEVMLMSLFKEYINSNSTFSDLINRTNIQKVFETFKLKKYEKNEKINGKNRNLKRIVLVLEGNFVNCSTMGVAYSSGSLLGEETLTNNVDLPGYLLAYPDCLTFEANLDDFSDLLGEDFRASTIHLLQKVIKMKKIPFLNNISENTLKLIVDNIKKEKYFPGQKIIEEGQEGQKFYIVIKGIIQITKNDKILRHLEKGSCFGEVGLLSKKKIHLSSAISLTNSSCYIIKKKDFLLAASEEKVKNFLNKQMLLRNDNIKLSDLCVIKPIGHGKFGNVSLVHDNKNNFIYACKAVIRKEADRKKRFANYLINERKIMMMLDHPFIVKLVKTLKNDYFVFFLMEYVNGMVLRDLINSKIYTFNKADTKFYIASLLLIVDYLHKKKIIQRDIKTNNIMINTNGYIKMIDFGTSKIMQDYTNTVIGTPHYMAPEVLHGKGYTFSCDYWSIGVCTFEIFYNKFPFGQNAHEIMEIYNDIMYGTFKFPLENDLFNDINQFISFMLVKQVNKRYCSLSKISSLEFFEDYKWEDLIKFKIPPPFIPKSMDFEKVDLKKYDQKYERYMINIMDDKYIDLKKSEQIDCKWAQDF